MMQWAPAQMSLGRLWWCCLPVGTSLALGAMRPHLHRIWRISRSVHMQAHIIVVCNVTNGAHIDVACNGCNGTNGEASHSESITKVVLSVWSSTTDYRKASAIVPFPGQKLTWG